MIRVLIFLLFLINPASAQLSGGNMFPGPGMPASAAAGYQGPGDIVSSATFFHSCGRAYNAAYANGTNPLCDVVLTVGGAAACTIRVTTAGFADLVGSYCAGSTTLGTACAAGCSITKMYDQSGNGRDVAQVTLASMPNLNLTGLNSLPCASAVVGTKGLVSGSSLSLAQPFTAGAVSERTGSFTTLLQIISATGQPNLSYAASTNTVRAIAGTAFTATASDSAFHALMAVFNNTSSQMTVDTTQGSLVAGGTTGFSTTFTLMNTSVLGSGMIGLLCEAWVYPVALSGAQQTSLNTNMHSVTNGWNF